MLEDFDITEAAGRIRFDSWGLPAIEAEVVLENGAHGRAMVPVTGNQSVETEENLIREYLSEVILFEHALEQPVIDGMLFKEYENRVGKGIKSPGVLALSMAVARAAGAGLGLPLYRYLGGTTKPVMPVPMMSMICGGDAEKDIDFQDIMVVPQNTGSYGEGLRMGAEIYHTLKKLLLDHGFDISTGRGGGFAAEMKHGEEALHYLLDAIELAGYAPGADAGIGIWTDGFPIVSIVRGLWRNDTEGRNQLTGMLGHRVLTGYDRMDEGNADVIEMKQAGTVSEVLTRVQESRVAGHKIIIASDFIDTEESFASDLAAAVHADYVKCGAPARGECTSKYNELLRIEEFYYNRTPSIG
ncbi:hypothetical protein [Lacrimispora sp. JR3]|uniref:hypothetical protein n=1 Tax=Lacrimispora sinapis TaxID=3111456 RepID=UPI00374A8174